MEEGGTMGTLTKSDILNLSVPERILLVEDIWDSVAEIPDAVPLMEEQKAELDRRLDAYHNDPRGGSPWQAVRERIRERGAYRTGREGTRSIGLETTSCRTCGSG